MLCFSISFQPYHLQYKCNSSVFFRLLHPRSALYLVIIKSFNRLFSSILTVSFSRPLEWRLGLSFDRFLEGTYVRFVENVRTRRCRGRPQSCRFGRFKRTGTRRCGRRSTRRCGRRSGRRKRLWGSRRLRRRSCSGGARSTRR